MEILTENDLLSAVEKETLIKSGRKESCEGIKYDFTLSNIALTVDSKGPINIDQSKENASIKPGEIAFVMTKETLELPDDVYCQLSAKRKLSLDGIVILG
jgi:deoxycytidine triphosphate deaminase